MTSFPEIEFKETAIPEVGFEVIDLNSLYQMADQGALPMLGKVHRINFYNLIIFSNGKGRHLVDFSRLPVERGSVIFINKGQIHRFDTSSRPGGKLVVFTDDYIRKVMAATDLHLFSSSHFLSSYLPSFKLNHTAVQSLLNLIDLVTEEYHNNQPNIPYLQTLFQAMLIKVGEASPSHRGKVVSQYHSHCFERFMKLLQEQFTVNRDAHQYASMIGTTYKTLNIICKTMTGRTVKQLIDAQTILEAKRQLVLSGTQVQQIAQGLGFEESSNFVKYFKKHAHMTPAQFRKHHEGGQG
ncbi:hypothetical protein BTA51_14720 [Hahella sp. CCB-MM4]|nr:hypothetical protein BTA51_14720 [Hahella sp. CCB-MM4]